MLNVYREIYFTKLPQYYLKLENFKNCNAITKWVRTKFHLKTLIFNAY